MITYLDKISVWFFVCLSIFDFIDFFKFTFLIVLYYRFSYQKALFKENVNKNIYEIFL
jgi:hypothetical protein